MRYRVLTLVLILMLSTVLVGCGQQMTAAEAEETCNSNLRLLEGAYQTHIYEEGSPPSSMEDLIPDYITAEPEGPAGGTYSFDENGRAVCTEHGTYDD